MAKETARPKNINHVDRGTGYLSYLYELPTKVPKNTNGVNLLK